MQTTVSNTFNSQSPCQKIKRNTSDAVAILLLFCDHLLSLPWIIHINIVCCLGEETVHLLRSDFRSVNANVLHNI